MDTPIWSPSPARIAASHLTRFAALAHERHGAPRPERDPVRAWEALWQWSVDERAAFWEALAEFSEWRAERSPGAVLEHGERMPGARWFAGTRLNFAENLLARRDAHPALVFVNEAGERRELSYLDLHARVARVAAGLAACGVGRGDVVAGFLPNLPEAVIAMLATASRGAIWTSCSPDFGINGVLDRFGQVRPKVLFTADGYLYAGKRIDSLGPIAGVLARLESVEHVVVVPYLSPRPDLARLPRAQRLADFERDGPLEFERLPFDAPLYIMYSSGTTGVPKCIVHGAGGTLLQHRKEHLLHADLKPEDRLFYFTTCGWMMWNWLVSGLAGGATLVLYEGSPFHPGPEVLWAMAAREGVTHFGTSPKYLGALEKAGYRPADHHDLGALRSVLSTGSPLAAEQFDYVYGAVKADVQLASISGGTDIISCFCLGNPWLPVYRGEIQCRGLGMAVDVWNDEGRPLRNERGELVCTRAFPSMPVGFWNDPDGARLRAAYFERFPGVWHHGDYAVLTDRGGLVILGRSDAVLNPGGVRIGTAEIYRQVERIDEVLEALAIGQDWQNDVRVVLFVRLRPGTALDEALVRRIKDTIRTNTTPRHVPAKVVAVPDIPRTISGKIVELAVRNVVHGLPVRNTDALANPEALEHFRGRPELAAE
ncbi:MAG: acetoacetate--CoA ligase [Proteobacteria bacterium]|nr:acetoacetate--CoA ligase [Pseudomonadota bacterium]